MGSTRKTRNYKEKSSMLAFGHFVLPLAAIVALGLLFMGIKLFFLTPADRNGIPVDPGTAVARVEPEGSATGTAVPGEGSGSSSQPQDPSAASLPGTPGAPEDGQGTGDSSGGSSAALLAGPISSGSSTSGGQSASQGSSGSPAVKTPQSSQPSASSGATGDSARRPSVGANAKWGVQIGAFQREEGAATLVDQVTKEGYTATVTTGASSSGKVFHRVRVAAGDTKEDATKLASELEKKGYPVLVVSN